MTTSDARILLVDCDAFFVQVARLEDPAGAGQARLLVVGGSPTGRGVVTSASYEARAYGVRSAMPTAQALRLCPEATVVGVPRGACSRRSKEVLEVLRRLAPVVQPASIDEFYLDLKGTERLFRGESLKETATRIRDTVYDETKIEVSLGGGPTRLLAKLAVGRAKPHGVFIVAPGEELAFMREHRLSQLPGVGPSLARALENKGLRTVTEALGVEEEWLKRWFGEQRGHWLHRRIRGIDGSRVRAHEPRKSISSERTFFRDIDDDAELEKRLRRLAGSVARTLRSKGLRTRTVTVKIRDADFTTRSGSFTLPEPVESDAAIVQTALDLFADLRRKRPRPVRLLGVGVTNLMDRETPRQLTLFDTDPNTEQSAETERDRKVSRVIDDLRDRFGHDSIGPGGTMDPREGE